MPQFFESGGGTGPEEEDDEEEEELERAKAAAAAAKARSEVALLREMEAVRRWFLLVRIPIDDVRYHTPLDRLLQ